VLTLKVKDFMGWQIASDFAARIKNLREVLGLTQAALGMMLGVNGSQVSMWERGEQRPHKKSLNRWAEEQGWPVKIFAEGGPMPLDAVNLDANGTLGVEAAMVLRKIGKASEALSRASGLLADGATEEAKAVLRRTIRVEDYDEGA